MATRRKNASTRVPARQRGARKVAPSKGGRKKTPTRPVAKRPRKTVPKAQKRRKTPSRAAPKAAKPKKTPPKGKPKARRSKRRARTRTPGVVKRAKQVFHKLRKAAFKSKKLVFPVFTKKKGKLRLRGTKGKERTIVVGQFWEDVREGWLAHRVRNAFVSLASGFDRVPTLYTRFTFTVTKVRTVLTAGSPKVIRATKKQVKHWFFSTGLSYNVEGAMFQFEKGWDTLSATIQDAMRENVDGAFFLEYVTCVAYVVQN